MDRKLWFACVVGVTCPIALALDVTVKKFKEFQDCTMNMLEKHVCTTPSGRLLLT